MVEAIKQRSWIQRYALNGFIIKVHYVMTLEQRTYYKWMNLTAAVDMDNDTERFDLPHLYPHEHRVQQDSLVREIEYFIERRLMAKPQQPHQFNRELDVGE